MVSSIAYVCIWWYKSVSYIYLSAHSSLYQSMVTGWTVLGMQIIVDVFHNDLNLAIVDTKQLFKYISNLRRI